VESYQIQLQHLLPAESSTYFCLRIWHRVSSASAARALAAREQTALDSEMPESVCCGAGAVLPELSGGVCCCADEPKQSSVTNGVEHVIWLACRGLVTRWYLLPLRLSSVSVVFPGLSLSTSSVSCV